MVLKKKMVLFILILLICLGAGRGKDTPKGENIRPSTDAVEVIDERESIDEEEPIDDEKSINNEEPNDGDGESETGQGADSDSHENPSTDHYVFEISEIPHYAGEPYIVLNENRPLFLEEEMITSAFEAYSNLDGLGRCGVAYANVCKEIMPTDERGEIGYIKPSGWHTVKYNDLIDGNYLYNRCHLIAYRLAGENANEKNLITGTRYLNTVGMMPFESMVWSYVQETGNHVLYRVTPIFDGDDLVASGVTMEAFSVEDNGDGICFYVYVYNVQPGIIIDYASGESRRDPMYSGNEAKEEPQETPAVTELPETPVPTEVTETPVLTEIPEIPVPTEIPETPIPTETPKPADIYPGGSYVLNTNTHKFHLPTCPSVSDMAEKNKRITTESRDEIISQGYVPCKRCNP